MVGKCDSYCLGYLRMLKIYPEQRGLTLQGHFEELVPTSEGKFLPGIPWELGWKVVGILPPISVVFWGIILVQNLPSDFLRVFENFHAFSQQWTIHRKMAVFLPKYPGLPKTHAKRRLTSIVN